MTATTPIIEPIVLEIIIAVVAKIKGTMPSIVTILTFFYWSNCNTDWTGPKTGNWCDLWIAFTY